MTETHEFVVPRSIPIIFPIAVLFVIFRFERLGLVNDYASEKNDFFSCQFCHLLQNFVKLCVDLTVWLTDYCQSMVL
ncbi:MAG: hypothetical protein A3D92_23530 [Bacteroidetes bacterium RIFCSPHIGHO2_02_FULL_44_7]|nr:MAG: hypothetical protein A3D92_23530 [Bacteroidetes bacterium RIFCSPHIGHO2_02_FULL_44_7]